MLHVRSTISSFWLCNRCWTGWHKPQEHLSLQGWGTIPEVEVLPAPWIIACVSQCFVRNKVCSSLWPALKFALKMLVEPCRKEGKDSLIILPELCPLFLPLHEQSQHLGDTTPYPKRAQGMGKKKCETAFSSGVFLWERWYFCNFLLYIFFLASLCSLWLHVSVWERKFLAWWIKKWFLFYIVSCRAEFWFKHLSLLQAPLPYILETRPQEIFSDLIHSVAFVTQSYLGRGRWQQQKSFRWNHLCTLLYKNQLAFM